MKTAEQFLDILAGKDLVEEKIIAQLMAQAKQATAKGKSLPAEKVADLLIEKEYLTRRQATAILDSIVEQKQQEDDELSLVIDDEPESRPAPAPKPAPQLAPKQSTKSLEEELGLAPDPGSAPKPAPKPAAQPKPIQKPAAKSAPQPKPASKPAEQQKPAPQPKSEPQKSAASLLEEELGLTGGGSNSLMDDLMGDAGTGTPANDPLSAAMDSDPLASGGVLQSAPKKKKGIAKFFSNVQKAFGVKPKTQQQVKAETKKQQKATAENPWDSKLMLIGGGTLLGLCILGVALWFALVGQSGDEAFENAEKAYQQGSYTQSIEMFDKFIKSYPKHEKVGTAKVHRGLAQMRNAVDGSTNWTRSLNEVKTALSQITSVNEFPIEAPAELAALLPKVAENLANEAFTNVDPEKLAAAKEAQALLDKHVPESKRSKTLTANLNALISQAEDKLKCEDDLKACLEAMDKKIAENDSVGAYALRDECLKKHPLLRTDNRVLDETLKVSTIESQSVAFVEKDVPAADAEPSVQTPSALLMQIQTAKDKEVAGVADQILLVPGRDLYGVSAKDGQVKWTCPMGENVNFMAVSFPPTYISNATGSDFVMLGKNNTIQRRSSKDGSLKWSFNLDEVGAAGSAFPLVTQNFIFVSQKNGRIHVLDVVSGKQLGYYQLPQNITAGACFDSQTETLYQPGEHTNLFVISTTDKKCVRTIYLGHSRGDVIAPPELIGDFLVVPVNVDANFSEVRFFSVLPDAQGAYAQDPVQTDRIKGHINAVPLIRERRALICSSRGVMNVYELQAAEPPFKLIAQFAPDKEPDENLTSFCALTNAKTYKADNMFTMFDIMSSTGRLKAGWTYNGPCVSTVPPIVVGKTIFHVRNLQPVLVSAHLERDGAMCWQSLINDQIVGSLNYVDGKFEVLTEYGGLFNCTVEEAENGAILTKPICAVQPGDILGGIPQALRFPNGVVVCIGKTNMKELLVLNPEEAQRLNFPLRFARKAIFKQRIAGNMQIIGDSLAIPFENGQILIVNPVNGETIADPLVIEMNAGEECSWVLSKPFDKIKMVVSAGAKAYAVELTGAAQKAALTQKAAASLDSPVCSDIVVCQDNVLFATVNGGLNVLNKSTLQNAKTADAADVDSSQLTGLWSNGTVVLATSKAGTVTALDSSGKELWTLDSVGTVLVEPGFDGATALLCASNGTATLVNLESGEIVSRAESAPQASVAPCKVGEKWFGASRSGEIFEFKFVTE
ncbi:MAG: PQQ-binding-like beta-propeller repeat protein [Thermoguttaceae bacterium]|nr:PQQ-binding-like beta-propeller repeat protein [Thermoguttaceae bacterium]